MVEESRIVDEMKERRQNAIEQLRELAALANQYADELEHNPPAILAFIYDSLPLRLARVFGAVGAMSACDYVAEPEANSVVFGVIKTENDDED